MKARIIFKGNKRILGLINMVFQSASVCASEKFVDMSVVQRLRHMAKQRAVATYGMGVEVAAQVGDQLLSGELVVDYNFEDTLVFVIDTQDKKTYDKLIKNCSTYNEIGTKTGKVKVKVEEDEKNY
jgi:hypothetical protein